jgi:hypothetical protein
MGGRERAQQWSRRGRCGAANAARAAATTHPRDDQRVEVGRRRQRARARQRAIQRHFALKEFGGHARVLGASKRVGRRRALQRRQRAPHARGVQRRHFAGGSLGRGQQLSSRRLAVCAGVVVVDGRDGGKGPLAAGKAIGAHGRWDD